MSGEPTGGAGWFRWLIGTLIALLAAGGGIVALLDYLDDAEPAPAPTPQFSDDTSDEPEVVTCSVRGFVFNRDDNMPITNAAIGDVAGSEIFARTGPDGSFVVDCSEVESSRFPIRLVVMNVVPGCGSRFQSEVFVDEGASRDGVNIYVSKSTVEYVCSQES